MDSRVPPPSANANGAGYGNGTDDMSGFYAEVRLSTLHTRSDIHFQWPTIYIDNPTTLPPWLYAF